MISHRCLPWGLYLQRLTLSICSSAVTLSICYSQAGLNHIQSLLARIDQHDHPSQSKHTLSTAVHSS